ncbi:DUF2846 domain-containing protein [Flagellimonas sp. HMM57]|uniref:DUF2846 domain-containing protein n=1 Tax=unclassified Flagellimonas TaxID=2644544 RepID=UPI0013D3CD11|nr:MULTISPECIES: DUF2846 domain-containing protein [unclassified Flagellimonas]UII75847.1 DUF2846 domain-containing protein [Flagellimonas sp. HMM57]
MKTTLITFCITLSLLGNTHLSANNGGIDPIQNARVYVYRPANLVGFAWVFNLKLNGEKYAKIRNGKYFVLSLKPGKTTFGIKKKEVTIDLEAGKTYYLRSFIQQGFYIGKLDLVEVTAPFAEQEFARKPMKLVAKE